MKKDPAPEPDRPTYVAFGNSSIGLITLVMGALAVVAQWAGLGWLFAILISMALAGAGISLTLPEARDALPGRA